MRILIFFLNEEIRLKKISWRGKGQVLDMEKNVP